MHTYMRTQAKENQPCAGGKGADPTEKGTPGEDVPRDDDDESGMCYVCLCAFACIHVYTSM